MLKQEEGWMEDIIESSLNMSFVKFDFKLTGKSGLWPGLGSRLAKMREEIGLSLLGSTLIRPCLVYYEQIIS